MTQSYTPLVTEEGNQLILESIANGTDVVLKYFAWGDGNGYPVIPSTTQTSLVNEVYRQEITSIDVDTTSPVWLNIVTKIPGDVGGFTVREVGIFTENNILFAVASHPELYKSIPSEGTLVDFREKLILEIVNLSLVNITLNPSATFVTVDDINSHKHNGTLNSPTKILLDGGAEVQGHLPLSMVVNGMSSDGSIPMSGNLILSNTIRQSERIRLSGQEFYQNGNTSTEGLSILNLINRTGTKAIAFADSAHLSQNSSNLMGSIWIDQANGVTLSSITTDNNSFKTLSFAGSQFNFNNNIVLANGKGLMSVDGGGNSKALAWLSSSNQVMIGNDGSPLSLHSSDTITCFENILNTNNIYTGQDGNGLHAISHGGYISLLSQGNYFNFVSARSSVFNCSNCFWDGANWERYDTSQPASYLALDNSGGLYVSKVSAGANPIASWTTTNVITDTEHNLGTNGYQKLSSGLIMQWGTLSTFNSELGTILFPVAFPHSCLSVVGTGQTSRWDTWSFRIYNYTTTGATAHAHVTCQPLTWFAIGY